MIKITLFYCLLLALALVAESLTLIRIGSRKQPLQIEDSGLEFGRRIVEKNTDDDILKTFKEMQLLHARLLNAESLPQPAMSVFPAMSYPQKLPAMSLSYTRTVAPTIESPTIPPTLSPTSQLGKGMSLCDLPDLTTRPKSTVFLRLEVDTNTPSTDFVGDLSSGIASAVVSAFSLCLLKVRRLSDIQDAEVLGFDNIGQPTIVGRCDAQTPGATCHLVNTEFVVYASFSPPEPAGAQVFSELEKQAESGSIVQNHMNGTDIVAVRVKRDELQQTVNAEDGQNSQNSNGFSVARAAAIAISGLLCSFAVMGLICYRASRNRGEDGASIVGSKCDSSTITGHTGDNTAQQTFVGDSQNIPSV